MEFDDYQEQAETTAVYPEFGTGSKLALAHDTLGLAGESGEVCERVKKWIRGDFGECDILPEEVKAVIKKEVGDIMWHLALLCSELKISLNDAACENIQKLASRQKRGTLLGDGDDR